MEPEVAIFTESLQPLPAPDPRWGKASGEIFHTFRKGAFTAVGCDEFNVMLHIDETEMVIFLAGVVDEILQRTEYPELWSDLTYVNGNGLRFIDARAVDFARAASAAAWVDMMGSDLSALPAPPTAWEEEDDAWDYEICEHDDYDPYNGVEESYWEDD